MANIGTSLKNWSSTASSNQPDGTDSATIAGDLRDIQSAVRLAIASQDSIASAATTDLGSKDAGTLSVTGTTTITALGTVSAGIRKRVIFPGALTLTYNGTSLILPGGANITTAANDRAEFESLGSGNWRCNYYQKANGAPIQEAADGDKGDLTVASGVWTLDATAITGKAAETSPAIDDLLLISDTSESSALNKMTPDNFLKVINSLTEDTSPDNSADYILTYDASASGVKKVLMGRVKPLIGSVVATTSGTTVEVASSLPSWLTQITIPIAGLSTSGTSNIILQLGDASSYVTAGYVGGANNPPGAANANATNGFTIYIGPAGAGLLSGSVTLTRIPGTNTWECTSTIARTDTSGITMQAGYVTLTGALTRIRLNTAGGVETFDAGSASYLGT